MIGFFLFCLLAKETANFDPTSAFLFIRVMFDFILAPPVKV